MPEPRSDASRVLGRRLRERRLALALNQEAVAHLAGLNVSNYARIDRGHGNPTFHTLIRLAVVLGIEPSELLGGFTAEHLPPTRDTYTALDFRREQEARLGRPEQGGRQGVDAGAGWLQEPEAEATQALATP